MSLSKKTPRNSCFKFPTNSGVRVGQLIRGIVVGLQRERLSPIEGQHFGERCCVAHRKYLTITITNTYYRIITFNNKRQETVGKKLKK